MMSVARGALSRARRELEAVKPKRQRLRASGVECEGGRHTRMHAVVTVLGVGSEEAFREEEGSCRMRRKRRKRLSKKSPGRWQQGVWESKP